MVDKKTSLIIASLVVLSAGGFYLLTKSNTTTNNSPNQSPESKQLSAANTTREVTLYKSPTCGCCVGYAKELRRQGFNVKIVEVNDMSSLKNKYGIPANKQSCHTVVMGDYFVEGHVPMEAVKKLLKENPDVDGIGLPRMPSGTPGMPGPKRAPYEVYQVKDGEFSNFVTI